MRNNRRQFIMQTFGAIAGLAALPVVGNADRKFDKTAKEAARELADELCKLPPNAKGQMGISGHVFPPMTATQVLESHRRLDMHRKKLDEEMEEYQRRMRAITIRSYREAQEYSVMR
ncbi:hypothetical protein LCGC14_0970570 [marine sediment metagenome]|uniref:Uncharacterized protein n=1 Tax=marine sediment metagenome TaxID=412755 RepID=A0A0F9NY00_9ZZZZ